MLKIMSGPLLTKGREKLIQDCAGLLKTAGVFVYLVPTPQMQSTIKEAMIGKLLSPVDPDGGDHSSSNGELAFFSPQVYLFDGFVNEMLKDLLLYDEPLRMDQQKLILQEVTLEMQASGLPHLQPLVEYAGFYHSLQGWLKEVKAAGVTPETWFKSTGRTGKEWELGLIYQKYEEFLNRNELVDRERNYMRLIELLQTPGQPLQGLRLQQMKQVIVDGFYKLDQLQLCLLKALLRAGKDVVVHTYSEIGRSELFRSSQELIEQLQTIADSLGVPCVVEMQTDMDHMLRPLVLNHLCQNLFDLNAQPLVGNEQIQILHMADRYGEVALLGRKIKQALLEDRELKLDEIAVIFRNLSMYHFYIEEVFTELGIPYQIAAGVELSQTPVFKLILKLYRIFAEDWSRQSVVEVLKSHYLQLGEPVEMGRYEQLILEAGIIAGREQWLKRLEYFAIGLKRELAGIESTGKVEQESTQVRELNLKITEVARLEELLKAFFAHLDALSRSQSLQEHSQGLWDFFTCYGLKEQILRTRDHIVLRRDLVSLERLNNMLSELVQFGSGLKMKQKMTAFEFLQDVQQSADGNVIPEVEAQYDAVQILTPSRSRGYHFKWVLIGGLVEGEFPWYGSRDWLFTPEERKTLKERGIHFTQYYERLEEERLFFLDAVSTAAEHLVLSSPVLMTSESAQSSSLIREVLNLYVEGSIRQEDWIVAQDFENGGEQRLALTRRELNERLLQALWRVRVVPESAAVLAEVAATDEAVSRGIGSANRFSRLLELYQRGEMVHLREGLTFSKYDGVIQSAEIVDKLQQMYHLERVYSISQINDYAVCPFQFFCKRVLHLDDVEEPTLRLEPLDLGTLYHNILFEFFQGFVGWEGELVTDALIRMEEIARRQLTNYAPGLSLPKGLWTIYQEEIIETLHRLVTFEYAEAAKQGYELQPLYLEASFGLLKDYQEAGSYNHPDPVVIRRTLAEGRDGEIAVKFSGKIDRIDMSRDGRYLVIYDYKLGRRARGFEELEEGIDVQLPVYIKAVEAICGSEKEMLGAGYFSIYECKRDSGIWRDLREDLIPVTRRSKKFLNAEDWQARLAQVDEYVIEYIQQIRAGNYRLSPVKCPPYCKFAHICRYEHARNRRKDITRERGEV